MAARLPDFPWDSLAGAKQRAQSHPDYIVDLSVGTPVDPTPQLAVDALTAAASDWPGYPTVWGTPELRRLGPTDATGTIDKTQPLYGFKDLAQQQQVAAIAPIITLGWVAPRPT